MNNKVGFICRIKSNGHAKGCAHVWDGVDTLCRMWSSDNGLVKDEWNYYAVPPKGICKVCMDNPTFKTMQFEDFARQKQSLFWED